MQSRQKQYSTARSNQIAASSKRQAMVVVCNLSLQAQQSRAGQGRTEQDRAELVMVNQQDVSGQTSSVQFVCFFSFFSLLGGEWRVK